MKKVLLLILVMLGCVCAKAQNKQHSEVEAVIATINKDLPAELMPGMLLTNLEKADTAIIFIYQIDDQTFAHIAPMMDMLHDAMTAELQTTQDPDLRTLVDMCLSENLDIVERFTNAAGDKVETIVKYTELK